MGTPNATAITKVTLTRISSVTHAQNWDQRFLNLSFAQAAGGLNVTLPSSANNCPPGHYLLWILNGSGVPSVARHSFVSCPAAVEAAPDSTVSITTT